jgi:hypothetical protein
MHIPSIAAIAASALSLLPGASGHVHHVPTPAQPATVSAGASTDCRDGRWVGPDGISIEGRPDNFDAGDNGAVYLWHDGRGWHLRTTDRAPGAHHYSGTVTVSPGARFTAFAPVRNEKADRVWVTGDNVLHYTLTTYKGIDGLNDQEKLVIGFARQLLNDHRVDDATWNGAVANWGAKGALELTMTVGYYCMLACLLNVTQIEAPAGAPRLPVA